MKLIVVHYHLRPGGIRRVIELAVPQLVRAAPVPITEVVLATGERAAAHWHDNFKRVLGTVNTSVFVSPAFNYISEQAASPKQIGSRVRQDVARLLDGQNSHCLVWAHNLGIGRNLLLARELARACGDRGFPLLAHHHDWWFDNRWARWPEIRQTGFRSLAAAARAVFPIEGTTIHAAISQGEATMLAKHLRQSAIWLPNLSDPVPPPPKNRVQVARLWLQNKLAHHKGPVWLLPCRTLRRKNIAEALLLTRWLRPEAWLVVTGDASSKDELPYFKALETAAHQHHWRLRLAVLAGDESHKPTVAELMAVSETVLLTSIQEGFGLPYVEASGASRPLIARRLPNIAPDLHKFGFRFPQAYDDVLICPTLFDWRTERRRQARLFNAWRARMPTQVRGWIATPHLLAATQSCPVPFSQLTLTGQLEVLTHPAASSWEACAPLNPFLSQWRECAALGSLRVTAWPQTAARWLGGQAYGKRFFGELEKAARTKIPGFSPAALQSEFTQYKLTTKNLHPLLWHKIT